MVIGVGQRPSWDAMRLEILTSDDPRWQAFLERVPHDFYHLPSYTRLAAAHDGGRPEAVARSQ